MPFAGFADLDPKIDDPGGEVLATTIHNLRIARYRSVRVQYRRDLAILDLERAVGDGTCFGVDQLRMDLLLPELSALILQDLLLE